MNFVRIFCAALTALFLAFSQGAAAEPNLSAILPIGPEVTVGKLDNGLTYYIQKNSRPEKRLELRLVVKAGSVLEDEDQLGLAHVIEHMAFNGSAHFKKHELVSYLQSIGLKFGADLNAYTSFNETVYILHLPTDKPENITSGFLVLQDWAQGLSLDEADVDKERAIVLEELRQGRGAQDRLNKVLLPKILSGSLYAKRLPIGTEASLNGFRLDALKRFYKDWYRPDLMAVVVVGDIEVDAAKALVEKHFSSLVNPPSPRPRLYPSLAQRETSEAVVATDKEATKNILMIRYPVLPARETRTMGDYRESLVEGLFGFMLVMRMQELTQQESPPFVGGGSALSPLVHGYRAFVSSAQLGRNGSAPAGQALLQENARARQFGFSAEELERAKKTLTRGLERAFAEREKTDSSRFVEQYVRHFLECEAIPGIENEWAYVQSMMPSISLDDVNTFARATIPEQSAKLVLYIGSADTDVPSEVALLDDVRLGELQPVVKRDEKALAKSLMPTLPIAGSIVAQREHADLGVTELDLSNGLTVILKPTDFKNDEVLMGATRFGGQSLYGLPDKFNAGYAGSVAAAMGLGGFSPTDLQKMLAGKVLSVNVGLAGLQDVVSAYSSPADLESMLQVVALKFAPARQDPALYQSFVSRSQDAARNAIARPESIFSDAVQSTLYGDHPRLWLTPRPTDLDQLDAKRLHTIYQERFASARGMVFVLVGSFTVESIKPLITRYLASLPTPEVALAYRDLGLRPVPGVVKRTVVAGSEPKSEVSIQFAGPADFSQDERLRLAALVEVLNIKIIDVLREKLTLIYGGGMWGQLLQDPYSHFQLSLTLPCAPDKVDAVIAAAWAEMDLLRTQGPQAEDLAKVKQNWLTQHRRVMRENGHWMASLQDSALHGTDPALLLEYEKRVAAITTADLQAAARRYFLPDRYVQVVLQPKP